MNTWSTWAASTARTFSSTCTPILAHYHLHPLQTFIFASRLQIHNLHILILKLETFHIIISSCTGLELQLSFCLLPAILFHEIINWMN